MKPIPISALTAVTNSALNAASVFPSRRIEISDSHTDALAARHRVPAIYPFRYFAASGGLILRHDQRRPDDRRSREYPAFASSGRCPQVGGSQTRAEEVGRPHKPRRQGTRGQLPAGDPYHRGWSAARRVCSTPCIRPRRWRPTRRQRRYCTGALTGEAHGRRAARYVLSWSGWRHFERGPTPDSEQFRSAPRTCRPFCGRLSVR